MRRKESNFVTNNTKAGLDKARKVKSLWKLPSSHAIADDFDFFACLGVSSPIDAVYRGIFKLNKTKCQLNGDNERDCSDWNWWQSVRKGKKKVKSFDALFPMPTPRPIFMNSILLQQSEGCLTLTATSSFLWKQWKFNHFRVNWNGSERNFVFCLAYQSFSHHFRVKRMMNEEAALGGEETWVEWIN